jgi:probable HAF family extracellular repeat protein
MGHSFRQSIGIAVLVVGSAAAQIRLIDAQGAPPASYAIVDIGTLGGPSSAAASLNRFGDVVGAATTGDGVSHAFLYRNGQMLDLGTLPGGSSSYATAINDRGDIVGYGGINAYGPEFREFTQGIVWRNSGMRSVGALYCPCTFNVRYGTSMAFAVSNAGWVVGDSQTNRQTFRRAFVWQDAIRPLDVNAAAPGDSHAYGINDIHEVVGDARDRAFLVRGGIGRDLGVLPGHATSSARAINNKGQVIGVSADAGGVARAFLWDLGRMRELGTLPGHAASEALAINDASDAVGRSGSADMSQSRAVLWRGGSAIDLTALVGAADWTLSSATAINDLGQIVGVGSHGGQVRAYLLTPR